MRDDMILQVARQFGFSDARVIAFAKRCESVPTSFIGNALIRIEFEAVMSESPFLEEDED